MLHSRPPRPVRLRLLRSLLIWSSLTFAGAQSLNVTPPVKTFDLGPGQEATQSVDVTSSSASPFQINIYLSDWAFNAQGRIYYQDPGTMEGSACPWVTYSPASYLLEPKSRLTARYTVTVPADASPGTHWCVLFFDGGSPNAPGDKTVATFRLRVAQTIYVNVGPLASKGAISGMAIQPPASQGDPYRLLVQFENTGNEVAWVTGSVELRDSDGNQVRRLDLKGFTVLPSSSQDLSFEIAGPLPPGTYAALAVLDYGKALTEVAGQTTFTLERALPAPPAGSAPAGAGAEPPAGQATGAP